MADRSWDDDGGVDGVVATLDRLGAAAVADPVGGAGDVGRIRERVRRRRVRRRSTGALLALLPALIALLVWRGIDAEQSSQRVTTDPSTPHPATAAPVREEPLEVSSRPMAASPLSPRRAMASAWTGTELVVWGGEATGDGLRLDELGDGAAYDPATDRWRAIASGPLGPRARATATWTGTEVIVWGGESDGHRNSLATGAAYDPEADSWRTIAPAPGRSGRHYPSTAVVDRWLVVGGGRSQTPPETDVLVYDIETDSWQTVETPGVGVRQVVAAGERVALVGLDPSLDDGRGLVVPPAPADGAQTDRVLVRWLDPATGRIERAPDLALDGEPAVVSAHWADGALTTAVTTTAPVAGNPSGRQEAPGAVATIEPGSAWYRRRLLPPTSPLLQPVVPQLPTLWAWTGQSVLHFEVATVALFDPETGIARVRRRQRADTEAAFPTGFEAAQAWTGSEVLIWGGSSGGGAEAELATGARLRPDP